MFRAKICLTFAVLILLFTGGVYLVLHGQIKNALEDDAEIALRRSATLAEQAVRLDEFSLIEKARFTAQNTELYRTMDVARDSELYEQLLPKYPEATTPDGVRHVAVYDAPLSVDKVRLEEAARETKGKRELELSLYERSPAVPELFIVLDKDGRAVAALGKDRKRWWRHNIAELHPIVLKAVEENTVHTAIWDWSWSDTDSPDLYHVAIVPIRPTRDQSARGVVITGNMISDGVATRARRTLSGVTTAAGEADGADQAALEAVPEVAFFQGSRIVGSTFSSSEQGALKREAFEEHGILKSDNPEQLLTMNVGGERYLALVRFFSGDFKASDDPAGFIVLSSLNEAHKPVNLAMTNIVAIAVAIGLIGLVLFLLFIQAFLSPIARIEQGIGEILAGNKDYVFEYKEKDSIFGHILQGLNLVSAFLQGKPMPDDPDGHGDWGELMAEAGSDQPSASPGKVVGVAMPGMKSSKKPAKEKDKKDKKAKGDDA